MNRIIYEGTGIKVKLDIASDGFNMSDDNFDVKITTSQGREKILHKSDMRTTPAGQYIFTLDSAELGVGHYFMEVTAYVPDNDFDGGFRTEKDSMALCKVIKAISEQDEKYIQFLMKR